jgi:hypothetical protein
VNLVDVYAGIRFVEEHFDVGTLRMGDLDLWLFLRDVFVVPFSDHRVLAYQRLTGTSSHVDPLTATPAVPTRAPGPVHVAQFDRAVAVTVEAAAPRLEPAPGAVMQFHAYRDYSDVTAGGVANRIADAFSDLAADGDTVKVIEATGESLRARFRSPPIQLLPGSPTVYDDPAPGEDAVIAVLVPILEAAKSAGFAVDDRLAYTRRRLRQLYWRAEVYGQLLDRFRPAAVQVSSFSNLQRMAAVVAARRRDLPAIDVEHGYMGRLSAYGSLGYVAELPEPSVTIPSHFWCWGLESARQLERSLGDAVDRHLPIVGGSPEHVGTTTRSGPPLPAEITARVAKAGRVALFCWQPDELIHDDEPALVPKVLQAFVHRAPADTLLLFRLHPRSRHLIPLVERELRRLGAMNTEVASATLAPLPALIAASDVLLTSYSTVAFEANAQRVPVVLIDDVGADMMRDEVDRGVFHAATTVDELLALVHGLSRDDVVLVPYVDTDPTLPRRTLRRVLASAGSSWSSGPARERNAT